MKNLTKKELNKKLTDEYVSKQFSSYLANTPNNRKGAAIFAAGSLQGLLLTVMDELPYNIYKELIDKLKG